MEEAYGFSKLSNAEHWLPIKYSTTTTTRKAAKQQPAIKRQIKSEESEQSFKIPRFNIQETKSSSETSVNASGKRSKTCSCNCSSGEPISFVQAYRKRMQYEKLGIPITIKEVLKMKKLNDENAKKEVQTETQEESKQDERFQDTSTQTELNENLDKSGKTSNLDINNYQFSHSDSEVKESLNMASTREEEASTNYRDIGGQEERYKPLYRRRAYQRSTTEVSSSSEDLRGRFHRFKREPGSTRRSFSLQSERNKRLRSNAEFLQYNHRRFLAKYCSDENINSDPKSTSDTTTPYPKAPSKRSISCQPKHWTSCESTRRPNPSYGDTGKGRYLSFPPKETEYRTHSSGVKPEEHRYSSFPPKETKYRTPFSRTKPGKDLYFPLSPNETKYQTPASRFKPEEDLHFSIPPKESKYRTPASRFQPEEDLHFSLPPKESKYRTPASRIKPEEDVYFSIPPKETKYQTPASYGKPKEDLNFSIPPKETKNRAPSSYGKPKEDLNFSIPPKETKNRAPSSYGKPKEDLNLSYLPKETKNRAPSARGKAGENQFTSFPDKETKHRPPFKSKPEESPRISFPKKETTCHKSFRSHQSQNCARPYASKNAKFPSCEAEKRAKFPNCEAEKKADDARCMPHSHIQAKHREPPSQSTPKSMPLSCKSKRDFHFNRDSYLNLDGSNPFMPNFRIQPQDIPSNQPKFRKYSCDTATATRNPGGGQDSRSDSTHLPKYRSISCDAAKTKPMDQSQKSDEPPYYLPQPKLQAKCDPSKHSDLLQVSEEESKPSESSESDNTRFQGASSNLSRYKEDKLDFNTQHNCKTISNSEYPYMNILNSLNLDDYRHLMTTFPLGPNNDNPGKHECFQKLTREKDCRSNGNAKFPRDPLYDVVIDRDTANQTEPGSAKSKELFTDSSTAEFESSGTITDVWQRESESSIQSDERLSGGSREKGMPLHERNGILKTSSNTSTYRNEYIGKWSNLFTSVRRKTISKRLMLLREFQHFSEISFKQAYMKKGHSWHAINVHDISRELCKCPVGLRNCGGVLNESLLSHCINQHLNVSGVELLEIFERDRFLLDFNIQGLQVGKNTCMSILTYGGYRGKCNSKPSFRYMPVLNADLPWPFGKFRDYLPLLLMACRNKTCTELPEATSCYSYKKRVHFQNIPVRDKDDGDAIALWVATMEIPEPIHVMLTVFNKTMTTTRSSIVKVRSIMNSHKPSDFPADDDSHMLLTDADIQILSNYKSDPIYLEMSVHEYFHLYPSP